MLNETRDHRHRLLITVAKNINQWFIKVHGYKIMTIILAITALQAAIILVAMASGKNIWGLTFWRKSPIGDQQIKRKTYLKKLSIIG